MELYTRSISSRVQSYLTRSHRMAEKLSDEVSTEAIEANHKFTAYL